METLLLTLKDIPLLFKKNQRLLVTILMISLMAVIYNRQYICEKIFKKDLVLEFIEKTNQVQSSMSQFKSVYGADQVSLGVYHNGQVSVNRIHLMKFSVLFAVGDNSNSVKILYRNQPMTLWLDNTMSMIKHGYFIIPNMPESKDPLVRRVHEDTDMCTQVFLPIYKNGHLVGFLAIGYEKETVINKTTIRNMQRSLQDIESKL